METELLADLADYRLPFVTMSRRYRGIIELKVLRRVATLIVYLHFDEYVVHRERKWKVWLLNYVKGNMLYNTRNFNLNIMIFSYWMYPYNKTSGFKICLLNLRPTSLPLFNVLLKHLSHHYHHIGSSRLNIFIFFASDGSVRDSLFIASVK